MLTALTLTNFKAWERIDRMRLAPITALFGANSSGKSSILQFLLMLKQTADSSDRSVVLHFGDDKTPVSLGTLRDVVHAHEENKEIEIGLEWTLSEPLELKNPETESETLASSKEMSFRSKIVANGSGRLTVPEIEYSLGETSFSLSRSGKNDGYELTTSRDDFRFKRALGRKWPVPGPVKFYGYPDEARTYHQNAGFLSDLERELERMLSGVYYLGPLREFPKREYTWAGGEPADMGRRGEFAVAAILSARERGKISRGRRKKQLTLEEYVAHWLKELHLIHDFRVEEIKPGTNLYRVHVRRSPGSSEVLITDVGFGVSQVLPVIVLCYYAPEGSTILFEQPEIHLHPSVQRGLADVFIDAMQVRKVQIIVESHSEDFLRRLQLRVAEAERGFGEQQASIYFCDSKNGKAELVPLELDTYGNFLLWPKDFFGDPMGDIVAMNNAIEKRKKR